MDDMKRAIYLEVLQKLEKNKDLYICNEFRKALKELGNVDPYDFVVSEFFPEFNDMFDGYCYETDFRWEINKNDSWFSYKNRKARITLINFLLSNR